MRTLHPRLAGLPGALRLAALGLAVLLTCGAPVRAQVDDSAASYWTLEKQRTERLRAVPVLPRLQQRPTHLIRRAAPVRGYVPPGVAAPEDASPPKDSGAVAPETPVEADASKPDTQPANPQAPAKPENKAVIAVLGDSLGQLLAQGLTDAFADRPDVTLLRRAKENSGLARDDYFDWPKAARDLLDGKEKIDLAIMLVGSNDRQQMREGTNTFDPRTPKWSELYTARVKALTGLFREKKVPLIWVGLPIMNNERLSADMLDFNEIYKAAVAEAGGTYVDVWEAFADDRGQFSSYGPDVNGQMVRLRASDGVHFTKAGARKLAHFVEGDIRRILEKTKPALDPAAVAAVGGAAVEIPALAPLPKVPVVAPVVRPAAGAVVPLTAPPVSPGGRLLTSARQPARIADPDAALVVDQGLVQGRPQEARPGRADDFSWPR